MLGLEKLMHDYLFLLQNIFPTMTRFFIFVFKKPDVRRYGADDEKWGGVEQRIFELEPILTGKTFIL